MPIDYGSNNVATSGNVIVGNLKLDTNTLSSTSGNIIIQPSGTGALQRDDGGDARGEYAVDWQTVRSSSTMVAGGNYSVIGGGQNNTSSNYYSTVGGGRYNSSSNNISTLGGGAYNTSSGYGSTVGGGRGNTSSGSGSTLGGGLSNSSSGTYSTVGGGFGNTSSGQNSTVGGGNNNSSSGTYSTVGGGYSNTSSNNYSTVGGGQQNTSSGNYSTVGGGSSNTSSGNYSTVPGGLRAKATRYGELSHAAGIFAANGDAQHSIFVLRGKTTNASQTTTLGLDGSTTNRLTIASGAILSGTINIVGSISTGANVARYLRQFSIKRVANTTSLVGSIITLGTDEVAGTSISITADDTNEALQIQVTRSASETWRWVAIVDAVQIMYGA